MQSFAKALKMKIDDGNGHDWLIWAVQENLKTCKLLCKASSSNQLALYEEFNSLPDLTRQPKPCNVDYVGDVVFGS